VRHIAFGEGNYAATEKLIRELLVDADPDVQLPPETSVEDRTPTAPRTPETFLGSAKDVNYGGPGAYRAGEGDYRFPADQPDDSFALDGAWNIETQYATPADDDGGSIRLAFRADEVRMVLAGEGTVQVRVDGGPWQEVAVDGTPRSYGVVDEVDAEPRVLDVRVSPGVQVYSFTFG
jgi:hypothetical protein